jgi:CheY-like chemotaxis protein
LAPLHVDGFLPPLRAAVDSITGAGLWNAGRNVCGRRLTMDASDLTSFAMRPSSENPEHDALVFLAANGETARLTRAFDWSKTPVGPAADWPETSPLSPASSGQRLLIVDDKEDAAASLAMLLRLQGHEVSVASSGAAALELLDEYRPAMIFLDIGMPGLDGYEVARRIRRLPGQDNMTLIALTGWGQPEDRRRSKEAGFDHHLVKPSEPRVVEELLAQLDSQTNST